MVTLLGRRLSGRHYSGERHPEIFSRDPTIRIQGDAGRKTEGSLIHHSPLLFAPLGPEPTHPVAVIEAPLLTLAVALSGGFGLLITRLDTARIRAVFVAAIAGAAHVEGGAAASAEDLA
jgi:hypothetical protein